VNALISMVRAAGLDVKRRVRGIRKPHRLAALVVGDPPGLLDQDVIKGILDGGAAPDGRRSVHHPRVRAIGRGERGRRDEAAEAAAVGPASHRALPSRTLASHSERTSFPLSWYLPTYLVGSSAASSGADHFGGASSASFGPAPRSSDRSRGAGSGGGGGADVGGSTRRAMPPSR
jgi:hypothetical protein